MVGIIVTAYIIYGIGNMAWYHETIKKQVADYREEVEYWRQTDADMYNVGLWLMYTLLWPLPLIWNTAKYFRGRYNDRLAVKKAKKDLLALEAKKLEEQIRILEENGEL